MQFVLDSSVTLSWAFPDEWPNPAVRVREILETPGGTAIVPALWWFEVRNVLIVSERRGRITADGTAYFLDQLSEMSIETAPSGPDNLLLGLARHHRLSVYDSAYLALALEHRIPLATLDAALHSAARAAGASLLS